MRSNPWPLLVSTMWCLACLGTCDPDGPTASEPDPAEETFEEIPDADTSGDVAMLDTDALDTDALDTDAAEGVAAGEAAEGPARQRRTPEQRQRIRERRKRRRARAAAAADGTPDAHGSRTPAAPAAAHETEPSSGGEGSTRAERTDGSTSADAPAPSGTTEEAPAAPAAPPAPAAKPPGPAPAGITQTATRVWHVKNSLVERWKGDPYKLGRIREKGEGWELRQVRQKHAYHLGMRAKDVVLTVNGRKLDTNAQLLTAYIALKNKRDFEVVFRRNDKLRTHKYVVVD